MPILLFHQGFKSFEAVQKLGLKFNEVDPAHSTAIISEKKKNIYFPRVTQFAWVLLGLHELIQGM